MRTPNLDALEKALGSLFKKHRCPCQQTFRFGTVGRTRLLEKHGTLCKKKTKRGWRRTWQCKMCLGVMPGDGVNSGPRTHDLPTFIELGSPVRDQVSVSGIKALKLDKAKLSTKREAWFKDHNLYLASERWARIRREVLERDSFLCVDCLMPAMHVHHLTYERWQNERLDDLVALCKRCHEKRHQH